MSKKSVKLTPHSGTSINLDDCPVVMELDTGASLSVMSENSL